MGFQVLYFQSNESELRGYERAIINSYCTYTVIIAETRHVIHLHTQNWKSDSFELVVIEMPELWQISHR